MVQRGGVPTVAGGGGPRRRRRTAPSEPRRVVVLGAGLAGAFAAAAVSGAGRTVTVLERDVLPVTPRPRDGVPQGRQLHVLLRRGLVSVERLLPGFEADLRAAGAVPVDTGDLAWLSDAGWSPHGRPQFEVLSATRPLVEHLVLRRVRALPGVRVHDGARVERVRRAPATGGELGGELRGGLGGGPGGGPRWLVELADGTVEAADLVIDATGRASRLPVWLSAAGVTPARTTTVDARIGYAALECTLDHARLGVAGVVLLATPDSPMGGLALPVEGGRWLVVVVGAGDRRPPRDGAGMTAFAAGLRDPAIAEVLALARPHGDVAVHRQTANVRRHYESVPDWPTGLLVVGDALCALDPIYGQGITVAAQEALLLRRRVDRGWRDGDERGLLRGFARVAAVPWGIATGVDRRFPGAGGAALTRFDTAVGRWSQEVGRLSVHGDPLAADTMARVYHLVGSPWLLFRPGLLLRYARARVRGPGPANLRPPVVRPQPRDEQPVSGARTSTGR